MLPHANPTVVFKQLSDGAVLFAPSAETYFGLNEVGARVWQLLPPACESLDALCDRLAIEYPDATRATIRQDVQELLEALSRAGLVSAPAVNEQDAGAEPARAS